ncbi:YybS family protein [Clostridiisalibacter paucivorans]|uniref:YybS family protein n=1 Tax=Clostridiisalibacter paucivorans TaxID=408753 RepID=UPI00047CF5C5|nr:YybS family protein [Clostridiisalibacter paucivorans]
MNLKDKTTKFTEIAIITSIMTIFIFLGLYAIPIIFILYPVPFIVLAVRHGIKYSIMSILVSCALASILIEFFVGVFIFIIFGAISVVLGYMINEKYKSYQIIGGGTLISLVTVALLLYVMGIFTGINLVDPIKDFFNEALQFQKQILGTMDFTQYEINEILDMLKQGYNYTMLAMPTIIIISSVFLVYINYYISVVILNRLGNKVDYIPKFKHFKLPGNVLMGILVIFLGTTIIRVLKLFYYDTIFLNVITVLSFIFLIQGLAVVMFFLDRKKINKFIKAILFVLILLSGPLNIIISFIGVADILFNFRKIKR